MTKKFEDIYDWTTVSVGEEVIAKSVRDPDHANIFSDYAMVWGANAGMMDVGFYTYDRRGLEMSYILSSQSPVEFSQSNQRVTNTLVEKAMLKMPLTSAVEMATDIIDIARRTDPEVVSKIIARLNLS